MNLKSIDLLFFDKVLVLISHNWRMCYYLGRLVMSYSNRDNISWLFEDYLWIQ